MEVLRSLGLGLDLGLGLSLGLALSLDGNLANVSKTSRS